MKRYLALIPLFLFVLANQSAAQNAVEIGRAVKIVRSVDLYSQSDKERLKKGSRIRSLETVVTAQKSTGEFRLKDKTMLAVGPNSELLLDKFVYNPNPDAREVVVTHLKGGIRFVTGKSPSRIYKIKTPNTTIGVRGTKFDVYAGGPVGTVVLLLDGAVSVCRSNGDQKCRDLDQQGTFLHAPISGPLRLYNKLPDGLLDVPFAQAFPFLSGNYCLSAGMSGNQQIRATVRSIHGLGRERARGNICVTKAVPKPRRIKRSAPRRIKKRRVRRYRDPVYYPPRPRYRRPRYERPRYRRPRYERPRQRRPRYDRIIPPIRIIIDPWKRPKHKRPKHKRPTHPRRPKYRHKRPRYKDTPQYRRQQQRRRQQNRRKKRKKRYYPNETLD